MPSRREDDDSGAESVASISSDSDNDHDKKAARTERKKDKTSTQKQDAKRSKDTTNREPSSDNEILPESTMRQLSQFLKRRKQWASETSLNASLTRSGIQKQSDCSESTIHRSWRGIDSLTIDRSRCLNSVGKAGTSFQIMSDRPSRDEAPGSVRISGYGPAFETIVRLARRARGESPRDTASEYSDEADDDDDSVEKILQSTTMKKKYQTQDALNRLVHLSETPKEKYAMESEKANCVFHPILSKASRRAMKKVTEGQGQQHFIDRMENQEKQRLMNLQQQARHLEELRGTKKSSGKVWEKVANDFFQRLEKFERDREERIKAKKEAKYVSPVPRKEKIDPETKETHAVEMRNPDWKDVRDEFFQRMDEDKQKRIQKRDEAFEKRLKNDPVYTFKPQVNIDPKLRSKLGTFEERQEKDLEKRRERIQNHEKLVEEAQMKLERSGVPGRKSKKRGKKKKK